MSALLRWVQASAPVSALKWARIPPDCKEVQRVLQSYLDGELPESEHHLVTRHLEWCERCGIQAAVYRRVKASLAGLSTPAQPDAIERLRAFTDDLTDDDTP